MKPFWEKVEHYNRKLIVPALVLLLGLIIIELFAHIENEAFKLTLEIIDYLIIAVFVIDLIFLAHRARDTKFFFRHYWLDLLAVFPFSIIFNIVEQAYLGIESDY